LVRSARSRKRSASTLGAYRSQRVSTSRLRTANGPRLARTNNIAQSIVRAPVATPRHRWKRVSDRSASGLERLVVGDGVLRSSPNRAGAVKSGIATRRFPLYGKTSVAGRPSDARARFPAAGGRGGARGGGKTDASRHTHGREDLRGRTACSWRRGAGRAWLVSTRAENKRRTWKDSSHELAIHELST